MLHRTRVKEIEGLEEAGIEAAVDFLHASSECTHLYVYVCACVCMHTCKYVCVCVCMHTST